MMEKFENITRRRDGSYVIRGEQGPYHIPNEGEFADLWVNVNAYALAHPGEVEEETIPPAPDLKAVRASALETLRCANGRPRTPGLL